MTLLFEPFAAMFELSREFERLAPGGTARPFIPPTDVVVDDRDVTVTMDVPGFSRDELSVELMGDVLKISGERAAPYRADRSGRRVWQRLERGFGEFERVLRVPAGLDADAVAASLDDGVLTLRFPRPEARRRRRIQIGAPPAIETSGADVTHARRRARGLRRLIERARAWRPALRPAR